MRLTKGGTLIRNGLNVRKSAEPSMKEQEMDDDLEKRIRERAFQLWEADGRPDGKEKEHWERARAEVQADQQSIATPQGVTFGP